MALPSGMIFEVRWDADDRNSGGFNPERGGTDYSQQAVAQQAYTDLQIQFVNTNVFSATRDFISADLGNTVRIFGGTAFTTGVFEIVAVSASGSATLDRSAGTVGSTGGQARLGGAVKNAGSDQNRHLPGHIAVGGNIVYVSGGTYNVSGGSVSSSTNWILKSSNIDLPRHLIGYTSARGDGGRPTIKGNNSPGFVFAALTVEQQWIVRNFIAEHIATSSDPESDFRGIGFDAFFGSHLDNCHANAPQIGFRFDTHVKLTNCSVSGCSFNGFWGNDGWGGDTPAPSWIERCVAADCASGGFRVSGTGGGVTFLHCLSVRNQQGFRLGKLGEFGDHLIHCTSYGNRGDGVLIDFQFGLGADVAPMLQNCIIEGNDGYGIRLLDDVFDPSFDLPEGSWNTRIHRCAFFDNASGNFFHIPSGEISIFPSGSVFVNAANNDFRLNNTVNAGALLRQTAIPGLFLGLDTASTTGYADVGAVPVSGSLAESISGDQDNTSQDSGHGGDTVSVLKPLGVVTLLEDSDGIPPSGAITCDLTPTISWAASENGTGPFRYHWRVITYDTSGHVASGITLRVTSVELPEIDVGIYLVYITAEDRNGNLFPYEALLFWVRDCRDERPILAIEVPEFDLEKVIPDVDDYIRYLPQWMAVHGTATQAPSASFTFKFLQPSLREFRKFYTNVVSVGDQHSILQVPVRLPRLGWHIQSKFISREPLVVTVDTSGILNNVRRSDSLFDFYDSDDRVFMIGNTGHILLRNLALRETLVTANGSGGSLQFQYTMPAEPIGIVPDADVFFVHNGIEYRIKAGSKGIDADKATVQLKSPFSGPLIFRYHSRTLQTVVTVSISGEVYRSPDRTDLWNRFDEMGLLANLTRYPDEDNLAFKQRILSRFLSEIGTQAKTVVQKVAQDLTLSRILDWDGRTTISLSTSGIFGVSGVEVKGLPEIDYLTEELIPSGALRFSFKYSSSKSNWMPGYVIFVDGVPATNLKYPNLVVSGNTVDFGQIVDNRVFATFGYRNYTLRTSSQGYITHVDSVLENCPSGSYQVVISRNVRVHTPADQDYITNNLLNADGTPNGFFHELQSRLLEGSSTYFTRASWGKNAYWFAEDEDRPLTQHLPAVFDIGTP